MGISSRFTSEPSNVEIKTHLEYRGRLDVVSWEKLDKYFKVNELSRSSVMLVESSDASK